MATLLILALVLLVSSSTPTGKPIGVFILAGEGNMSGRGGVSDDSWDQEVPDNCTTKYPNSVIRLFATDDKKKVVWEVAREPLHQEFDTYETCGVGPGVAFGNGIIERDMSLGTVVGLVPCAIGGTRIEDWAKGKAYFNATVQRSLWAVEFGGSLRALLWYQGESDSYNLVDAYAYEAQLITFFKDIRDELGAPSLPIIQVALASGGAYLEDVRRAQFSTGGVQNVKTVDAQGLELEENGVYLTSYSQEKLGTKLAEEFLLLQST